MILKGNTESCCCWMLQAGVYVDRSNSGPYSNSTIQGGVIPLPTAGLQASTLTLRVFVDRSLIEVTASSFLCSI